MFRTAAVRIRNAVRTVAASQRGFRHAYFAICLDRTAAERIRTAAV